MTTMHGGKVSREGLERFSGVISLLLTPFHEDGAVDWPAYEAYVDWQLSHCPSALFTVCGSSEMKWLSLDERIRLARTAVRRAGAVPVVATANLDLGRETDVMHRMADSGISALVLVPPRDSKLDQDRRGAYIAELADASPLPVFLYEWPQVEGHFIPPDLFAELVNAHGVVGIKDTTCTLTGIEAKIRAAPEAIVYQANTPHLLDAIRVGARGVMAVTSAAAADRLVACWRHAVAGEAQEADRLHRDLVFLDAVLRFGYPATAKYLAGLRGVRMGTYCRWPVRLTSEAARAVEAWFEDSHWHVQP